MTCKEAIGYIFFVGHASGMASCRKGEAVVPLQRMPQNHLAQRAAPHSCRMSAPIALAFQQNV
jgi:hypothetical protein